MTTRRLAGTPVNPLGLGCMSLSHAYGVAPSPEEGAKLLETAMDIGVDHIDTAALYGFGRNESLVGTALKHYRQQFFLASKCGLTDETGRRVVSGHPKAMRLTLEASLRRLQTDVIDLYYLHRWDKSVPIEESVGALGDFVREGKIRFAGLSEVSAATLKKAHAEHPIAALQTEYSLWTRNPDIAVLDACRETGTTFVAFSPVGRGFLAGGVRDLNFAGRDFRASQPRFAPENFAHNLKLFNELEAIARRAGITAAQLSLAWVLSRGEHIVAIPGTTSIAHLKENMATPEVDAAVLAEAADLISDTTIKGPRYTEQGFAEVDTETWPT